MACLARAAKGQVVRLRVRRTPLVEAALESAHLMPLSRQRFRFDLTVGDTLLELLLEERELDCLRSALGVEPPPKRRRR